MGIKEDIRKFALQNAIKFEGKANPGAVVGKLIAIDPNNKTKLKDLMPIIQKTIKDISQISVEEQIKELQELAPELLEKKEKEERDIFAHLKITDEELKDFKTAFPPGPEKYPHIGHAKSLLLNYDLAKKHNGKFILRFEDTNPKLAKEEFYKIMLEDFEWLGVKYDELIYASDFMDLYYKYAQEVILRGKAYMCFCPLEITRENRRKGIECECRNKSNEQNLKDWKNFSNLKQGEAILRLKIDMTHKNSTMRDPTIFRLIDESHPRTKTKFKIWPNYDWQNAIMDSHSKITIRIRSKEFEMRSELQRYIQDLLKLNKSRTYEIARFNMKGVLSSGRVIREKVKNQELIGWDDPSLTTIRALKRRGFLPKAIHDFVISTGMTKSESTLTWDDLIHHNRKLLDKEANRYFVITNPITITIQNAPNQEIELKLHPEDETRGTRHFKTNTNFIIEKSDFDELENDCLYRLMDCLNFKKENNKFIFHSTSHTEYKQNGKKIMHWLPADNAEENLINVNILMPNKKKISGITEQATSKTKVDEVIQFERFGFCRLDKKNKENNQLSFWFSHN